MNNPLVSIIVPAYNAACFLPETIASVLNQTYQNWEMLIIDDGSTDNTLSIAKSYAARDTRIKPLSLGYNSGIPAIPRNYGMRRAKGSYFSFLDSDDIWIPEKLQKQVYFLEENPGIFWLYTKYLIEKDGKQLGIGPSKPKSGYIFNNLFLQFNIVPILTVMMRNKKERNAYFFDEDARFAAVEDYAMWLSIAYDEKISFIDEPLAVYRVHSKGISCGAFLNFRKCGLVLRKFSHLVSKATLFRGYYNFYRTLVFYGIIDIWISIRKFLRKWLRPET